LKYITNSGLIGFCGCYRQGDTFNVILEFADQGTLEQYFEKVAPPVRGDDIIDFWEGMFMTIRALQCIHQAGGEPNEGPQILHGYYHSTSPSASFITLLMIPRFHQDVKPANILVVSNHTSSRYKWEFKVADLGLSHFKRVINKRESVRANDVRGTRTYGSSI
jgi:serine/threonine protein kinase